MKRWKAAKWISLITILWGTITICSTAPSGAHLITPSVGADQCQRAAHGSLLPGPYRGRPVSRHNVLHHPVVYAPGTGNGCVGCSLSQALRIAIFFGAATLAGAFGGVLAAGITLMDGIAGLHKWQWIFIIEGSTTVFDCARVLVTATSSPSLTFSFYLPDSPATAWFLTPDECMMAAQRIADESDGGGHVKFADFTSVATDWKSWYHAVIALGGVTSFFSLSLFLPSIITVCCSSRARVDHRRAWASRAWRHKQ